VFLFMAPKKRPAAAMAVPAARRSKPRSREVRPVDHGLVPGGGSALSENASDMEDGVVEPFNSGRRSPCPLVVVPLSARTLQLWNVPLCLVVVPLSVRTL